MDPEDNEQGRRDDAEIKTKIAEKMKEAHKDPGKRN